MQSQNLKVMAVDDDAINLEILVRNLKHSGYDALAFKDGVEAWAHMNDDPGSVDIVLLDKMMPNMSGLEVLSHMQNHDLLKNVPVILQTGDVAVDQVKEGLALGAYYYLCKPFDPGVMISLVNAAARDLVRRNALYRQIKGENTLSTMMYEGRFAYRTIQEAIKLSLALSCNARVPDRVNTSLLELMVNAVEHGNLAIGYETKGKLLAKNEVDAEIERRLALPENTHKKVDVQVSQDAETVRVVITDAGKGFRWQEYMEFDPMRLTEPNGRGIATARVLGADITYNEAGNQVTCLFDKA